MLRRNFLFSLMFFVGGCRLGAGAENLCSRDLSEEFSNAIEGINLGRVSNDLLLAIFGGKITDRDRWRLVQELILPNANFYIDEVNTRKFGLPGHYRLSGGG